MGGGGVLNCVYFVSLTNLVFLMCCIKTSDNIFLYFSISSESGKQRKISDELGILDSRTLSKTVCASNFVETSLDFSTPINQCHRDMVPATKGENHCYICLL